jgi:hypothetical protein
MSVTRVTGEVSHYGKKDNDYRKNGKNKDRDKDREKKYSSKSNHGCY